MITYTNMISEIKDNANYSKLLQDKMINNGDNFIKTTYNKRKK